MNYRELTPIFNAKGFREMYLSYQIKPYSCVLDVLFKDNTVQRYGIMDLEKLLIMKNFSCTLEDMFNDDDGNNRIKIAAFNTLDSEIDITWLAMKASTYHF